MDRDIKIFNRPIMEKIQKKNHEMHLQRLKNIRSGTYNRVNLSKSGYRNLNTKKSAQIEEEKRTQIQKQNLILFNKMSKIMHRPDQHRNPNASYNLHNSKIVNEYTRIRQENKNMYHRLESQKPTISNKRLLQERNRNLTLLKFMGKYPNKSAQRIKIDTEGNFHQNYRYSELKRNSYSTQHKMPAVQEFQIAQENSQQLKNTRIHKKYKSESVNEQHRDDSVNHQNDQNQVGLSKLQEIEVAQTKKSQVSSKSRIHSSIILFQARALIAQKHAQIYFQRYYDTYRIKAIFDSPIYGELTHIIDFSEDEGNQFFSEWNYDYPKLIKLLKFQNRTLCFGTILQEDENGKYFSANKKKQAKKKQWVQRQDFSDI